MTKDGIRPHTPMTEDELDRKRKSEEMFMSRPIPIYDKKNMAIAIMQLEQAQVNMKKLRRNLMKRAREIGAEELIPENWNDDGTLEDLHRLE